MRFAEDPWLVGYAGEDGQATAFDLQAGLDWVRTFTVASDRTIYLAGNTQLATSHVRVDHLSATGELLASAALSADLIAFDAMAMGRDGKVYLVAESKDGRQLVTLTPEAIQENAILLEDYAATDEGTMYLDTPQRLEVASDGSLLLQGGEDILWVQKLDVTSKAGVTRWARVLASNAARASVFAGGVFATADGGALVGVGTGWTNAYSGLGNYSRSVQRLAADGRITWSAGDSFTPRIPEPDVIRRTSICPLADSVILANLAPVDARTDSGEQLLDSSAPAATVARYTMVGDLAQSLVLPGVLDVVSVGPTSAVFLSATQIARFDLPALQVTPGAAGARCTANGDCASGACCAGPSKAFESECSTQAQCVQGDLCVDDASCNGKCLRSSLPSSQGFCSQLCAASNDCPKGSFCAEGSCLAACASAQDCPYAGVACTAVLNAESVMVTACKPQEGM